jgi:hypothetical protein
MTNYVHLVAVPERADSLARTLGCTHSEYALAPNHSQARSGHVSQNRFFSCLLGESCLRPGELNPVRAPGALGLAVVQRRRRVLAHGRPQKKLEAARQAGAQDGLFAGCG